MANLLCERLTRYLYLNPNHKSRFDNPIKHDLLEKDKTMLLVDTISFPNNCLFTQKVVYQTCEFATQREFQLIFKSQYTCWFFCTETSQHEATRSFTKAIWKSSVNSLNSPIGTFWDLFSVYLQRSLKNVLSYQRCTYTGTDTLNSITTGNLIKPANWINAISLHLLFMEKNYTFKISKILDTHFA